MLRIHFTAADLGLLRLALEADPLWESPLLWRSEFLSVLSLYHRKKLINYDEAILALDYAQRLIGTREHKVSLEAVVDLAFHSSCSSYDCEFIALAKTLGTKLITYDKQMLQQFPAIAIKPEDYLVQSK